MVLTNEAYDAMGGVEGAIASVAEDVFKKLPERDQERLPRLFIQLVSVGEESEDTRRRAPLTTLGEETRSLIGGLATARLLVTSSEQGVETVEVAHEALIRHWDRSKGWVNNARSFLTWRKRLEPFVDEWQNLKRDRTTLLRGGLLAEAQRWLAERPEDLDAPEREFIEASVRQQEGEKQAEARRKRLLVRLAIASVVAAFLAASLGAVAWWQWGIADKNAAIAKTNEEKAQHNAAIAKTNEEKAQHNAAIAKTNEEKALRNLAASLAAQSAAVRDKLPQRSVLLASESVNIFNYNNLSLHVSSEQSLRDSLQHLGGLGLCGHQAPVWALAISPDGRWLATGSEDQTVRLWALKAEDPGKSARVLTSHQGDVLALAISPDGRWLATGSENDKTARLWDLKAEDPGETARVLAGHQEQVWALALSPDGRWLVTGSENDKTARLWDLKAEDPGKTARVLTSHQGDVLALAISPDGRWLATGSDDHTARLWDLKAEDPGKTARVLTGHQRFIDALAISPDGRWLVTGSWDATARLWDLKAEDPGKTARVLAGHLGPVTALAISPDGR
jgi:hypothetical protein